MEIIVKHNLERSPARLVGWGGVAAVVFSVTLTAVGTFTGEREDTQVDFYWVNVVLAALTAMIVFGVVVRRALDGEDVDTMSRRAQLLGALALVLLVVFWTGVPQVLAVAAGIVGYTTLKHAEPGTVKRRATTGVALGALSAALLALLALQEVFS